MADFYLGGDRSQAFLLPPDPREWLPQGHLAWLTLEFVAAADTSAFHATRRLGGRGRPGFDPDALVALLLYCYAQGERSSRRIEQLCETDVACRVIMAHEVPDHSVIARFRKSCRAAFVGLFEQLLAVCAAEGMGRVGTIALDGTKVVADASRTANRTREQLRAEIAEIVAEAEVVDAQEDARFGDARGDELPDGLAPGDGREARLRAALADLDEEHPAGEDAPRVVKAREEVDCARRRVNELTEQRRDYERRRDAGDPNPAGNTEPVRPAYIRRARDWLARAEHALESARRQAPTTAKGRVPKRNTTDPDSRLMRSQGGWVQAYNAQAAVAGDGLIIACEVTKQANETQQFTPMLTRIADRLDAAGIDDPVRAVVADAGYHSADNLAVEGPPRLIPPRRDQTAEASCQMRRRLEQPAMARLYQRRLRAEAAFGRIKHNQRTRRFSMRGLDHTEAEWHLICAAHNLNLLRHRRARNTGPDGPR